jgi:tripartite-type tricarboxylate transporter receptor subunit TctC
MNRGRRRFLQFAGAIMAAPALVRGAQAQGYPARAVRVIVPFAPGGITDVLARLIAEKWSENLGKQFYVENVTGGSGNIGMGQAAKAAPDGYTILTAFVSYVVNPAMFAKVPYDPVRDFEPIGLAVTSTTVLVVNPQVPAKTVDELVALIRANPGKYNYASAGSGTSSHLAGEQFRLSLGLDIVHIPFTGGAPAIASVVAGHTPIGLVAPNVAIPQIPDGKVRALAVTSAARAHASRCRHLGGIWSSRHRGRQLGRVRRARRHAEGHRRDAQSRDRSHPRPARHEATAGDARLRSSRRHARPIRRADQVRARDLEQGDPRRRHQADVRANREA